MNVVNKEKTDINVELFEGIKTQVLNEGSIAFSEFMHQALYHKKYGYYTSNRIKFGAKGDFITAPTIGKVFAKCLAQKISYLFESKAIVEHSILEIGAGDGTLAADLVQELQHLDITIKNYNIVDISTNLKQLQKQTIQDKKSDLLTNYVWHNEIPENFSGVVIANELLDALPVNCFCFANGNLQELRVGFNSESNELIWVKEKPNKQFKESIDSLNLPPEIINSNSYISEVNQNINAFIQNLFNKLKQSITIFIDYGFSAREYYHPDRNTGTLVAHHNHKVSENILLYPGLQDITAHVDFSYTYNTAVNAGFDFYGYTNFANFLFDCNLIDVISSQKNSPALNHEINLLTSPAEMGELFKVIIFGKNVTELDKDLFCFREFGL